MFNFIFSIVLAMTCMLSSHAKDFSMTTVTKEPIVSPEGLIMVGVKNEFDEEIKVKFDTNREYPIGPNEWISLGERKPGKYTLTIYNKKGDFVDNLSLDIAKKNKFTLNKDTVSNSNKITGLSTGQKVAITTGAIGATAIGAAILGNLLMADNAALPQAQYIPPAQQQIAQQAVPPAAKPEPAINNAFATGGKPLKVLNTAYEKVIFIVEGTDSKPIGNNWSIPKASIFKKPEPLVLSGQNILISPKQKVKVILPDGSELTRNSFELDKDPIDGSYIWTVK